MILSWLKGAAIEGTEEGIEKAVEIASDVIVMQDKSELERYLMNYKAKNPNATDVDMQRALYIIKGIGVDMLSGGCCRWCNEGWTYDG